MKPVLDDLPAIQVVRGQIERLYQTDPHIHIDISPSPKLHFSNDAATIIGVYPFIFRIEEYTGGSPKQHTLQYTDVLIKKIVIRELEKSGEWITPRSFFQEAAPPGPAPGGSLPEPPAGGDDRSHLNQRAAAETARQRGVAGAARIRGRWPKLPGRGALRRGRSAGACRRFCSV